MAMSGSLVHYLWFSGSTQPHYVIPAVPWLILRYTLLTPRENREAGAAPFLLALSHAANVSEYLFSQ